MDDINGGIPQFGTRVTSCHYVKRPSAYAIIRDADGRLCVVQTSEGAFLPGGGLEVGETPDQAVLREVAEECGFAARVERRVGAANQLLYAESEQSYYEIPSVFFEVLVVGAVSATEPGHQVTWLSAGEASQQLSRESHRWIVAELPF